MTEEVMGVVVGVDFSCRNWSPWDKSPFHWCTFMLGRIFGTVNWAYE